MTQMTAKDSPKSSTTASTGATGATGSTGATKPPPAPGKDPVKEKDPGTNQELPVARVSDPDDDVLAPEPYMSKQTQDEIAAGQAALAAIPAKAKAELDAGKATGATGANKD